MITFKFINLSEKFNQRTAFLIDMLLGIYPSNSDVR